MICEMCGQEEAKIRYVTRSYGHGPDLLIIEDVPVVSCRSCGESYLTAETLHEIDRIREEHSHRAKQRLVPVAGFAA